MWGQLRPVQAASAPSDSAAGAGINNSSAQQQQNQTTATKTAASPPAAPVAAVPLTSAKYEASAATDTSAVPAEASSSADLIANATARSIVGAGNSVSGHVSSSSKSKSESKSDPPNDATCSADNDNDNGQAEGHSADTGAADEWGFDDDPFFNDDGGQGGDVNTTDAVDSNKKPDEKDEKEEVGPDKSPQMQTRSSKTRLKVESVPKNNDEEEGADDLIAPSSTMLIKSNRRLGDSDKTRSAVTANKKHKSSMQPKANLNSRDKSNDAATMELAQRKFAAAVRKIEDDDNWDFDDDDAAAGGDGEADDAAAETTAEGSSSMLHEKLVQYSSSLSSTETPLVRSLNSLLEAEL